MDTQQPRLMVPIALIVLVALLVPSSDAQLFGFHSGPFEQYEHPDPVWLPLQVGNKWTYEHNYRNFPSEYAYLFRGLGGASPHQAILRIILDTPYSNVSIFKRFTLEITHTEKIGGVTYYVFSDVDYNWPPVPNLFFAGKKVSTTGAFPGPDLYNFSPHHPQHYFITDYPLLQDSNPRVTLEVGRDFWRADDELLSGILPSLPPTSLSQEAVAIFQFANKEPGVVVGVVGFVSGYGLVSYELREWGYNFTMPFINSIIPVSAVIDGKEIEYPYKNLGITHVQPTSWGQLKARHGPRP